MKFESDLQVLRHSDEAVEGERAEEEDDMVNWWKHLSGICVSFHKSLCWVLIWLPRVSISSHF